MITVVIPTRYEPQRVDALVRLVAPEVERVIVLDNGHEPALTFDLPNVEVVDTRGDGLYRQWNRGRQLAGPVDVAILNDDIHILPGTLRLLAAALRSQDDIGCVYPDRHTRLKRGLPIRIDLTVDRDPVGSREMTGYCFMFRGELDLPPFDEGYAWWYGDTQFDEDVRLAGYGVAQVNGLPIEHVSDAEADGWQRRPELKVMAELDGQRWTELHAEIRDGRWQPSSGPAVRTVLLVPRRRDNGHRDKVWDWCRARWEREFPGWPIYEGHHDQGPFNRSAAINAAADLAGGWDVGVVIDADIFVRVSQAASAVARARDTGRVTWAHRRWRGLSEEATSSLLKNGTDFGPQLQRWDMDLVVERTNPMSWSCCVAIPRKVWDDLGGFDERFRGWGWEDMAFMSAILGLYGYERIEGDVYHVWHPRSEERIVQGRSRHAASPDYIVNARLGRRYMAALRRDHAMNDRSPTLMTPDEIERDVANLKHDDAKFAALQPPAERAKWDGWWPTLEELRDGAKQIRGIESRPTITAIVHTGGAAEHWPERSTYLRQSLASFAERVDGPIVQRVVYSDWDDEFRDELVAIAQDHGFYVVGDGHHGYTGSMQRMWTYIKRRAQGAFIFQTEDDFIFERPVDLRVMADTLRMDPGLVQIALLRDAFYQDEKETGGILGWPEPAFTRVGDNGTSRLEHRLFFTANPSLFRKSLTDRPWPQGEHSETLFGKALIRDPGVRFAFWGQGETWVRHIGHVRAGVGY